MHYTLNKLIFILQKVINSLMFGVLKKLSQMMIECERNKLEEGSGKPKPKNKFLLFYSCLYYV